MKRTMALPALLLAAACSNGPDAITAVEPVEQASGSYSLYGVVSETAEAGLRPSAGSEVTLARLYHPDDSRRAITDSHGRFSVSGLAAGRWTLVVNKQGYETDVQQLEIDADMSVSFTLERSGRHSRQEPRPRPV